MSERSYAKYLPTTNERGEFVNQYITVKVYYDLGGCGMFDHKNYKRGFYISVMPQKIEDRGSYKMFEYGAYTGYKAFLFECNRFSEKKLEEAKRMMDDFDYIVDRVCKEQNLTLRDDARGRA